MSDLIKTITHVLPDEQASIAFAQAIVRAFPGPLCCYCQGSLGAGKTTMIRAMLRALGVQGPIASPSFTMIEHYTLPAMMILHIDLYRVQEAHELAMLALMDYDPNYTFFFIEWPEHGFGGLPPADLCLHLSELALSQQRQLSLKSCSAQGAHCLIRLLEQNKSLA